MNAPTVPGGFLPEDPFNLCQAEAPGGNATFLQGSRPEQSISDVEAMMLSECMPLQHDHGKKKTAKELFTYYKAILYRDPKEPIPRVRRMWK